VVRFFFSLDILQEAGVLFLQVSFKMEKWPAEAVGQELLVSQKF
jgi:hypothetical protein